MERRDRPKPPSGKSRLVPASAEAVGLVSNVGGAAVLRISCLSVLLMCPARTGGKEAMWSKSRANDEHHTPKKPNLPSMSQRRCNQIAQDDAARIVSSRCCWEANGCEPKVCIGD